MLRSTSTLSVWAEWPPTDGLWRQFSEEGRGRTVGAARGPLCLQTLQRSANYYATDVSEGGVGSSREITVKDEHQQPKQLIGRPTHSPKFATLDCYVGLLWYSIDGMCSKNMELVIKIWKEL